MLNFFRGSYSCPAAESDIALYLGILPCTEDWCLFRFRIVSKVSELPDGHGELSARYETPSRMAPGWLDRRVCSPETAWPIENA